MDKGLQDMVQDYFDEIKTDGEITKLVVSPDFFSRIMHIPVTGILDLKTLPVYSEVILRAMETPDGIKGLILWIKSEQDIDLFEVKFLISLLYIYYLLVYSRVCGADIMLSKEKLVVLIMCLTKSEAYSGTIKHMVRCDNMDSSEVVI